LNDSLIQFWTRYVSYILLLTFVNSNRYKLEDADLQENEVYFFTSYFYSTLTKAGKKSIDYASVSRWTAKTNLFNYKYIVIPINEEYVKAPDVGYVANIPYRLHWYLAIIANPQSLLLTSNDEVADVQENETKDNGIPIEKSAQQSQQSSDEIGLPEKVSQLSIDDERKSKDSEIPANNEQEWPPSQENGGDIITSPFSGKHSSSAPENARNAGSEHQRKDAGNSEATPKGKKGRRKSFPILRKYDPEKYVL